MKRRWIMMIFVTLIFAVAMVNAQFSRDFSQEFMDSPIGRAFMQSYGALKSNYLTEIEDEVLIEGAIRGMIESLEDPFTSYTTPEVNEIARQDRTGSYEGIGAALQALNPQERTRVQIINVFQGSPAMEAGLQRGDVFATVDGESVEDATIDDIVRMVRGPEGTTVELGMIRPGVEDILHFSVVRGDIPIIDVESTVLPENVGYVHLSTFSNQRVYDQLHRQLAKLKEQGITSLILDLRNNGGGFLNQGILVADEFLTEGDIVFQRARGVTQRLASADPAAFELPMVVLVNRNSASASEIVAGALQDNGRALVIGEETFGKGVGQSVLPLTNGGELVYKSFEWLTPDRSSINKEGIQPDVVVEDSRLANIIALEGQGADPGAEVEIIVDGKSLGTVTADEEGAFSFFQAPEPAPLSSTRSEALVDLETDQALQVAYETVLEVRAEATQATQ